MILVYTILIGLAAFRLWRLVAVDEITEPWRVRRIRGSNHIRWFDKMLACPWCLGSWVAFGLTWATDAVTGLRMPVLVGLAAAVVVGVLGEWL